MLVDCYDPEDVFARVPEVATQTDPVLKRLDQVLEDDQLYKRVRADLGKRYRFTLVHGRHSTPVEVILRMLLCKHLYGWSYEETRERVADSLVLRWFCRVYFQTVPDKSTLIRWTHTLRPETLHALNDRVAELAKQAKVTTGRKLRLDATCVQTTIHHPTDSGLLVDSVRVLSRLVKRAKPLVAEQLQNVGAACRSRLRSARQAAQRLHRLLRRKSEEKIEQQKAHYRKLIETAEQMVRQTERVVHVLEQQTETASKQLHEQAERVVPLIKRVIAQTRSRVLEGKKVASLLSLLQLMTLVGLIIYLPLFLQGVLGESATYSGAVITPLTISSVIGASVAGALVATFKRYQLVTIIGGIVSAIGVFLLAQMTISTSLLQAAIFMVIAGLGLGVFFSVLTLAAQNTLPRTSLGVGTGAIRFLGQLGAVLGVAIVGSIVNSTVATDIVKRLPPQTVQRLTPAGVKLATNPQVLVNSTYHDTVVKTAQSFAVRAATANIPPGPLHDQVAAQAIHQTITLLNQVFAALKESLAVAIQHGFIAVFIFSVATVVVALFLNDIPLSTTPADVASQGDSEGLQVFF